METMIVSNIFNMSFGKTFLVGHLSGNPSFIGKSTWRLFVNDQFLDEFEVEGEQIPLRKSGSASHERVLATSKHIDKANLNIGVDSIRLERTA